MKKENKIKQIVKNKYGKIAISVDENCCGPTSCCGTAEINDFSAFNDDYSQLNGYVEDADLSLGCGIPTEFADIKEGDTVLDLGCGAGNDVFVARQLVGKSGKVIGLDFTNEMLNKAKRNNEKLGYENIEFKLGDIEKMPIEDNSIDVIISNCVLNLVPNKQKGFSEIYRTLKSNGRFCVSDVVIKGQMSEEIRNSAELYVGCVSGAINEDEYLNLLIRSGFKNVEIKKSKKVEIPNEILRAVLLEQGLEDYHNDLNGVFSITVVGTKF